MTDAGKLESKSLTTAVLQPLWRAGLPRGGEDTAQHATTLVPCSCFHRPAQVQRELTWYPAQLSELPSLQTLLRQEQKDLLLSEERNAAQVGKLPVISSVNQNHPGWRWEQDAKGETLVLHVIEMQLGDITGGGRQLFVRSRSLFHQSERVLRTLQLWEGLLIPGQGRDASLASLTRCNRHPPTLFSPAAFS